MATVALAGGACERGSALEPARNQIPAVQTDTHTDVLDAARAEALQKAGFPEEDARVAMSEYARPDAKQAAAVVSEQRQRAARKAADLKANPPGESSDGPRCLIPGAPGGFCEVESGRHFTMEL